LTGNNPEEQNKIIRYFKLAMPFVYLCAGLLLVLTPFAQHIIAANRTAFGLIFIAYSAYRIYLILRPKKNTNV
jgi:hypothetical protein